MNLVVVFIITAPFFTQTYGICCKRTVANPLWNDTVLDRLRNDLLTNYDRYAMPSRDLVNNVSLSLRIYQLDTDEIKSKISIALRLKLSWFDPKLVWNPNNYDGLDFVAMADHEIWQPDLYLLNSATSGGEAIARYGNAQAITHSNGGVLWVTPLRFTALCQFNLFYWPFDTQHCQLEFGSWSLSIKNLQLSVNTVVYEPQAQIGQWNMISSLKITTQKRDPYPDVFHRAVLDLGLSRKSTLVSVVVTVTVLTVTVLVLIQQFVVLKDCALTLSCFVSIAICLCLLYFSTNVASIASYPPWIVTFFTTALFFNAFTSLKLVALGRKHQVPWIIKMQLHGKLGQFLLLTDHVDQKHSDWDLLTVALDRIFFLCYSFIFLVLFIVYLV